MKILLTGGGTGGHIFPLLAVAKKLKGHNLHYYGPASSYDAYLTKEGIVVEHILGAKLRRYFSLLNLVDIPKFGISVLQSLWKIRRWQPDVCFSKGGPGSLPILYACHLLKIPIILHESDTVPGLTNQIASRWATKYLKAWEGVGIPLREELLEKINFDQRQAKQLLGFHPNRPLILVVGGSQGSQRINKFIFDSLPQLLEKYQILHQVGEANFTEGKIRISNFQFPISNYCIVPSFNTEEMALAYAASDVIISRAGSVIFEIAAFGKPSILIPLPEAAGNHQLINAKEYTRTGAAIVIEEPQLTTDAVIRAIEMALANKEKMTSAARGFARLDAAETIAREIIELGHRKVP